MKDLKTEEKKRLSSTSLSTSNRIREMRKQWIRLIEEAEKLESERNGLKRKARKSTLSTSGNYAGHRQLWEELGVKIQDKRVSIRQLDQKINEVQRAYLSEELAMDFFHPHLYLIDSEGNKVMPEYDGSERHH